MKSSPDDLGYFILHKPRGTLSSRVDANVTNLIQDRCHPRFGKQKGGVPCTTVYDISSKAGFPTNFGLVGRLDKDTSGIMLMTNDNQLATALRNPDDEKGIEIEEDDGSPHESSLLSPSSFEPFKVKVYRAIFMARKKTVMSRAFSDGELEELAEKLSDPFTFRRNGNEYHTRRSNVQIFKQFQDENYRKGRDDLGWCIDIEIRISEGKHHQIRRIASRGNFCVLSLVRTCIASILHLDSIPNEGDCRYLTEEEVQAIKGFCSTHDAQRTGEQARVVIRDT